MENLPEELIENICLNMNITELKNFIRTSKTHYRICDEILDAKFEETIDNMIKAVKKFHPGYGFINPESNTESRSFVLSYISSYYVLRENIEVIEQFALKKLNWTTVINRSIGLSIEGNESEMRLILLDLLTNGYITGEFTG